MALRALRYGDDEHYDIVCAFIKSIRGSDPDAGLYWLAHMLEAGEDARFVARRLVILASEDVGLADPQGLLVADAAARAVEYVGLPEARLNLGPGRPLPGARAPKSNPCSPRSGGDRGHPRRAPRGCPSTCATRSYPGAARSGTARATGTRTPIRRAGWSRRTGRPRPRAATTGRAATARTSSAARRRGRDREEP